MATSVFEEIRVSGEQVIEEVRRIIKDSSVRKLTIKNKNGKVLMETPLTLGAIGMGGLFLLHPIISAVAAFTMFTNDVRIEVEREKSSADDKEIEAEFINVDDDPDDK